VVIFNDSEWLKNIATAIGTDELDMTVGDEYSWTIDTMSTRTIYYWKTYPDTWCNFPSESMFANKEQEPVLLTYSSGNGAQVDGLNLLEMLRAQLIASELNYAPASRMAFTTLATRQPIYLALCATLKYCYKGFKELLVVGT